jgi:hypothetical protein
MPSYGRTLMPSDKISRPTPQPHDKTSIAVHLRSIMASDVVRLCQSIPGNDTSGTDIKSNLTASSSQKVQNWYYYGWILTKK